MPAYRRARQVAYMDGASNESVAKVAECDTVTLTYQASIREDMLVLLYDAVICSLTHHYALGDISTRNSISLKVTGLKS
jgi:hypothetical protein